MLTHGELFAGISGFGLALERAGIMTRWHVEIDPACQSVLRRHYPDTPVLSDVCECGAHNLDPVDIITFGSPCQDLSVAGKREGLSGERSGLFFEAVRIVRELRPAYAVWENVPGAFSSNGGRDFGAVLDALAESGALDIGWAILDAQWFGVAQRRRRLFVVADFRGRRAAEILSIPEGSAWDSPPSREEGQRPTSALTRGLGSGGADAARAQAGWLVGGGAYQCHRNNVGPMGTIRQGNGGLTGGVPFVIGVDKSRGTVSGDIAAPLRVNGGRSPGVNDGKADNQCVAIAFEPRYARNGRGAPSDVVAPLKAQSGQTGKGDGAPMIAMAFCPQSGGDMRGIEPQEVAGALHVNQKTGTVGPFGVRRLTPTECERLQGFPDGWTDGQSDSARYRQLGNAVCVPVAEWIGRRIVAVGQ